MTKQGLAASGHLLIAEAHLVKAREKLAKRGRPPRRILAYETTVAAIDELRRALELLEQESEERCQEDTALENTPRDDHWYHKNPNY